MIYYNRKRLKGLDISKGDRVYLLYRNFKTNKPSNKLDFTKLSLFLIKEYRGDINYILNLLKLIKRYNIFYILLLEKVNPKILL